MSVASVDLDRLGEVLEGNVEILLERLLALGSLGLFIWRSGGLGLGVQATQLLQDLGVVGVDLQNLLVGLLGAVPVLLLLKHRADLEPDVGLGQRVWRVRQDVLEALQGGRKHALVLVNDTETEVDLVGLVKVGVQVQHTDKGLFSVLQGAVTVVQDTDSVPQLGHIGVVQEVESTLVGSVSPLQVVHHEIAVAQEPPCVTVLVVEQKCLLVELGGLQEVVSGAVDVGHADEPLRIVGVVAQGGVVGQRGLLQVTEGLRQGADGEPRLGRCFGEKGAFAILDLLGLWRRLLLLLLLLLLGGKGLVLGMSVSLSLSLSLGLSLGMGLSLSGVGMGLRHHLHLLLLERKHNWRRVHAVGQFHRHLHRERHEEAGQNLVGQGGDGSL